MATAFEATRDGARGAQLCCNPKRNAVISSQRGLWLSSKHCGCRNGGGSFWSSRLGHAAMTRRVAATCPERRPLAASAWLVPPTKGRHGSILGAPML